MRPLLHLVTPIVWRVPGHGARKLSGFARAEQASRIDLLLAARATPSTARQAAYLRHAADETRHAQLFSRRSAELREAAGKGSYGPPHADTENLFERLGEVRFLAFVHRGEARGREQFEVYAKHFGKRGDARTAAMFQGILVDEARHQAYTRDLLVELVGSEPAARRELRKAAAWEAWRTWRRAGRALAGLVFTVAMTAVYCLAGPPTALVGWLARGQAAKGRRARWLVGERERVRRAADEPARGAHP